MIRQAISSESALREMPPPDRRPRAPLAMQQAKAVFNAAFEMPHAAHLAFERQTFSLLFSTADKQEGVSAFLEKRQPVWNGR